MKFSSSPFFNINSNIFYYFCSGSQTYCLRRVSFDSTKILTQKLHLPEAVEVTNATSAAGHLSSSFVYPFCTAPYLIITTCSDCTIRFWKCDAIYNDSVNEWYFNWSVWKMMGQDESSFIDIPGKPIHISAAYCGRLACAYKCGKSFTRPSTMETGQRYVNVCIAIYECESTGGGEWILEDTLQLKNITLDAKKFKRATGNPSDLRMTVVSSFSTLQSLRENIVEHGNMSPFIQKSLVQMDWASKEDGSHILTVVAGNKIMLFATVCSDLAQSNIKAMRESLTIKKPILRKSSSFAQHTFHDEIRWMQVRLIKLNTADELPALPMKISWVRDGILLIGMDTEIQIYSQWKSQNGFSTSTDEESYIEDRSLKDEDLNNMVQENLHLRHRKTHSKQQISKLSMINLKIMDTKRNIQGRSDSIHNYMPEYGLFEASRVACPSLPQYHPKQLMEFLNSGKIGWVKAILSHLVYCINNIFNKKIRKKTCGIEEKVRIVISHFLYPLNHIDGIIFSPSSFTLQ